METSSLIIRVVLEPTVMQRDEYTLYKSLITIFDWLRIWIAALLAATVVVGLAFDLSASERGWPTPTALPRLLSLWRVWIEAGAFLFRAANGW